MANRNVNQYPLVTGIAVDDEILIWDRSAVAQRKTTFADLGSSGFVGASGTTGTSGSSNSTSGTSGTGGSRGTSGNSGTNQTSGSSGSSGTAGTSGTSGTSGSKGFSGLSRISGGDGASGTSGTSGATLTVGTRAGAGTSGAFGSSTDPTLYAQLTFNVTSLVTDSLAAGTYLIHVVFEMLSNGTYDCYFRLYKDNGTAIGIQRQRQATSGKRFLFWCETVTLDDTAIIQVWAKSNDTTYTGQIAYGPGSSISWVKLT